MNTPTTSQKNLIAALFAAARTLVEEANRQDTTAYFDLIAGDVRLVSRPGLGAATGLSRVFLLVGDTHVLETQAFLRERAYTWGDDRSLLTALEDCESAYRMNTMGLPRLSRDA